MAQMRKLLQGDRGQQTGVRRGALDALTWTQIVQQSATFGMSPGKNCYLLAAPVHARPLFSSAEFAVG